MPTVVAVSCAAELGTKENYDLHQEGQCSGTSFEIRCFRIQGNATIHNTTALLQPLQRISQLSNLSQQIAGCCSVSKKTFLYHTSLCAFHLSMRVAATASHIKLSLCTIDPTSCGHRHHGGMELEVYVFLTSILDQPIVIISFFTALNLEISSYVITNIKLLYIIFL